MKLDFYNNIALYLIYIATIFLNEKYKKTFSKALMLFSVAFVVAFVTELLNKRYGLVWGTTYTYTEAWKYSLLGIPLQIVLSWPITYYLAHGVTNMLSRKNIGLQIILDCLIMVGFDLLAEPVMTHLGAWTWIGKGPYFGVPLGNFVGWIIITTITSVIVRKILHIQLNDKTRFVIISFTSVVLLLIVGFVNLILY